jgi:hypothetical protein
MSSTPTRNLKTSGAWLLFCAFFLLPLVASGQAAPQKALISVDAQFESSRLPMLDLELLCSQAAPGRESIRLTENAQFDWATGELPGSQSNCALIANLPEGYTASFKVDGSSPQNANATACQFRPIKAGQKRQCQITITQDPVPLMVYLSWIGPSGEEEDVRVDLSCESGEYSGYRYVNEGKPEGWEIRDIDPEGILCNVNERVRDNFRPDIIDCQGLWIRPGKGEECTLTNTKIVKRIETLNRYGQLIMILLVLGVGLIAVKRFS